MKYIEQFFLGVDTEWWKTKSERSKFLTEVFLLDIQHSPQGSLQYFSMLSNIPPAIANILLKQFPKELKKFVHKKRLSDCPQDVVWAQIMNYQTSLVTTDQYECIAISRDGKVWRKNLSGNGHGWNSQYHKESRWNDYGNYYETSIRPSCIAAADDGTVAIASNTALYFIYTNGHMVELQPPKQEENATIKQIVLASSSRFCWVVWSDKSVYCYDMIRKKALPLTVQQDRAFNQDWIINADGSGYVCFYQLYIHGKFIPYMWQGKIYYDTNCIKPIVTSELLISKSKNDFIWPISSDGGAHIYKTNDKIFLHDNGNCFRSGEICHYEGKITVRDCVNRAIVICDNTSITCYDSLFTSDYSPLKNKLAIAECDVGYKPNYWSITDDCCYLVTVNDQGAVDIWECPLMKLTIEALVLYYRLIQHRIHHENNIRLHDAWIPYYNEIKMVMEDEFHDVIVPVESIDDCWMMMNRVSFEDNSITEQEQDGCELIERSLQSILLDDDQQWIEEDGWHIIEN